MLSVDITQVVSFPIQQQVRSISRTPHRNIMEYPYLIPQTLTGLPSPAESAEVRIALRGPTVEGPGCHLFHREILMQKGQRDSLVVHDFRADQTDRI